MKHTAHPRKVSTFALTAVVLGVAAFSGFGGGPTAPVTHAAVVAAAAGSANEFAPAGEGFSASFPARPERVVREVPYSGSFITMCNYVLSRDRTDYVVSWMGDFKVDLINQPETQSFFYARLAQNMINSARQAGRGELRIAEQSDVEAGGFKGRRFKFDSADSVGEMRAYKVGLRFYTAGVFGPKSESVEREAGRFLDSVSLKATKAK